VREAQAAATEQVAAFAVREYMLEPMLVPETLAAAEVFTRMRENAVQMAVVIDEFGGTAGIVTLQDIVSHLIGRVQDQDDDEEGNGHTADGVLHLDGLTGLVELREQFDIDLLDEGYDVETLGGYVFFVLGRPAIVGDEVQAPTGQRFVVEEMDGLRVARVQIQPAHDGLPAPDLAAAGPTRTAA
jgi:CBS domain containing-hemolysin-like protein